jgi:dTDP-4-dehydrorhamnose reductase
LKILVTGAKGQLGIDVVNTLSKGNIVIGTDVDTFDITNIDSTINLLRETKPDLTINCAAYTNVDGCEENIDTAYRVNALGARNLAIASLETGARLLHISTDFVFDGNTQTPYIEFDDTNPLSIYGKSKLAGENFIKEICPKHFILRTAWLYGKNGNNFVKTMLKLSKEKKVLNVVDDQIGSPTFTVDLISAMELIMTTQAYGTYHVTNNGEGSWNGFAKRIFEYAGIEGMVVNPITSKELNRAAERPKYSVLRNYMLEMQFDYYIRDWEEALKAYFV